MRSRASNWIRTGIVLALLAGTQSGCKSGWTMPGADMFSWTRKPSETTLSGSSPSMSMPSSSTASSSATTNPSSTGPLSPATRSAPNPINSTAANPPSANRPYGNAGMNALAQPNAMNTMAGQVAPIPGAAATSNGYSTGNYATNPSRPSATPSTNPYGVPNANLPGGPATTVAGPYGSYPPSTMTAPPSQAQYPVPQAGGLPPGAPRTSMANVPPSMPSTGLGFVPPASSNVAQTGIPGTSGYTPAGTSPVPTIPAGYGAPNASGALPPSSMPIAYGGTAPSGNMPNATPSGSATASTYRPGSVARPTSYDFSNPGQTGAPTTPGTQYPNTATLPSGTIQR